MLSKNDWAQRMQTLQDEGAGAFDLSVWFAADVPLLLHDAWIGDDQASAQMLKLLGEFIQLMQRWDRKAEPPLCFCCGAAMPPAVIPRAFVIIIPKNDQASVAVGGGACDKCVGSGNRRAIMDRALAGWRETIDSSIRVLEIHPDSGHA